MTKEELINQFKEEFHIEDSPIINYLEEMYLIGKLDGYNKCLDDYFVEITMAANYGCGVVSSI